MPLPQRIRDPWRTSRRLAATLATMLGVVACTDLVGPGDIEPTPRRFDAPSHYADLWAQVEACSDRKGSMARVRWFYVPGPTTQFEWKGKPVTGLWFSGHSVVLAEWAVDQDAVVRHEMLHDLLGGGGHPELYFRDLCGSIVSR